MKNFDKCTTSGEIYGMWYGFPECCVQEFVQRAGNGSRGRAPSRKLRGTGFVPCANCNKTKTELQLLDEIAANRICPEPFPGRE